MTDDLPPDMGDIPPPPIDFFAEKVKRRAASGDNEKLSKSELYYQIIAKMNDAPFAPADWPRFPRTFHFVADRAGRKAVLEELAGGIVAYRDQNVVADSILQYCWESIPWVPGARRVDYEAAARCRNMWLGMTRPLPRRPEVLLEHSHPGLTFKRLPFDAPPSTPLAAPPHFEALLGRMSDPMSVCAFIGSLFYPESDRQQYLYLYGEGGDGKGALMRFLHAIFGDAATSLSPPSRFGDKFWNFNTYGKRLGLFYDCEDWDWFRSSHFKSLTGGDPILFEEKGRSGFTDVSDLKVIAASNSKPNVSSQSSDMRRLIFVSCKPVPEDERVPHYDRLLLAEAEDIIRTCKAIYLERCPSHKAIPVAQALEVAWEAESYYIDLFNSHYVQAPGCEIAANLVRQVLKEDGIRSNQEVSRVKAVWGRAFGVTYVERQRCNYYVGMATRQDFTKTDPPTKGNDGGRS